MMHPSIKPTHAPRYRADGEIWIGSPTYGLGQAVDDRHGVVRAVLECMDGSRTRDEIRDHVRASHSRFSGPDLDRVVDYLISSGHTEDLSAPTELSARQQERHARGRRYYEWVDRSERRSPWEVQERLAASTVAVIGTGGIGGAVATMLAAAGVGHLSLADFDVVELSNLNRQVQFTEDSVGRSKVDATARALRSLNSDVEVAATTMRFDSSAQIEEFISDVDFLALCADTPRQIPYWANEAALRTGIPWLACGYDGPMINICCLVPGVTPCYRCLREADAERIEREGRRDVFPEDTHPMNAVIAPTAHLAGSWAAYEVIRFLGGLSPRTLGRAFHQNLVDYDHSYYITAPADKRCAECGSTDRPRA